MASLAAYHKTDKKNGAFSHTFYKTKKTNPKIGDYLYVISGKKLENEPTKYLLEGRYEVLSIDYPDKMGFNKLNLTAVLRSDLVLSITDESWFNNIEFKNKFASGQSMSLLPEGYKARFDGLLKKRELARINSAQNFDAIDDLGSDSPDRAQTTGFRYRRDPAVRNAVMARSKGSCELCGKPGFLRADGTHYLESHHIIALAKDGSDRLTNVIALCPDDHRKAHFGERGAEMEDEMILKLKDRARLTP